jgi:hypothetical protein
MDNLVFENVPVGLTSISANSIASTDATLDLDADGTPDVWIAGSGASNKDGTLTTHHFTYTRRTGLSDSAVILQSSRDGTTWSGLTAGLDYTVESRATDAERGRETLRLNIPTDSATPWQFRLLSAP